MSTEIENSVVEHEADASVNGANLEPLPEPTPVAPSPAVSAALPTALTGHQQGYIEALLTAVLTLYVSHHQIGRVIAGKVGFQLTEADDLRVPDLIYISNERFARVTTDAYLDVTPELAVEILSPNVGWSAVQEKLTEYFETDVQEVWLLDPSRRAIHIHSGVISGAAFGPDQVLKSELLPGFTLSVGDFFNGRLIKTG